MMALDEDAVVCDFFEYYRISDTSIYTIEFLAKLACGLPSDARIIKKLNNQKLSLTDTLLASVIDILKSIEFLYCKRNFKGDFSKPKSVLKQLLGQEENENENIAFDSAEEFEKARLKAIKGDING